MSERPLEKNFEMHDIVWDYIKDVDPAAKQIPNCDVKILVFTIRHLQQVIKELKEMMDSQEAAK